MNSTPEPEGVPPETPDIRDGGGFLYVAREIVVNSEDVDLVADELTRVNAVRQDVEGTLGRYIALYQVPESVDVPELVERLRDLPGERQPRVGPNHVMFGEPASVQPNIVVVGQPKYHGGPGDDPWPAATLPPSSGGGSQVVRVAVIDTGIDPNAAKLPLLKGRLDKNLREVDLIYVSGQPSQIDLMGGHGTMVAGIIARHAPGATVMAVQVLQPNGVGNDVKVAHGMLRALTAHADVLNLSLGGSVQPGQPPTAIDAVLSQHQNDAAVVASAGNTVVPNPYFYPACDPRVVSVAALDTTKPANPPASFSNSGVWVRACAPGERIHSTYVTGDWAHGGFASRHFNGYASWSGTSFAAPHVAALIATAIGAGNAPPIAIQQVLQSGPPIANYGFQLVPANTTVSTVPPP